MPRKKGEALQKRTSLFTASRSIIRLTLWDFPSSHVFPKDQQLLSFFLRKSCEEICEEFLALGVDLGRGVSLLNTAICCQNVIEQIWRRGRRRRRRKLPFIKIRILVNFYPHPRKTDSFPLFLVAHKTTKLCEKV